jgi:hypothetical protein
MAKKPLKTSLAAGATWRLVVPLYSCNFPVSIQHGIAPNENFFWENRDTLLGVR